MFNLTLFEQKIYDLVTREVNDIFSNLLARNQVQENGVRVQRQILAALHDVAEETNTQISYGLTIGRPPAKTFRYGSHLFETVALESSTVLLVCKHCKKAVEHDYAKHGEDFEKSTSKLGKECELSGV